MAGDWGGNGTRRAKAALITTEVPNAARVVDVLSGGQRNFEADRRAAQAVAAAAPVVAEIPGVVRAFQRRVLRYLVAEAGIREILDIGSTGLPLVGATHEIAQSLVPECRVAYADDDLMVLAHARALLKSAPGGAVGYVDAGIGEPAAIIAGAGATLDWSRPVAVLLLFTLAYVPGDDKAAAVVRELMAAVAPGSYLVLYHLAGDMEPAMEEFARQWNKAMPAQPITLRSRAQVAALAAGLDPVPPGLVPVTAWRPDPGDPRPGRPVPIHAAVARKP
jgi:hypothetical protein